MTSTSLKKNSLGRALFSQLRELNFAYVDKTRFIEELESVNYPFIVRPRRFGKSMFAYTLQAYYDRAAADHFQENFAGTYIASHKTPLANQFCVLRLEFSGLSSATDLVEGFQQKLKSQLITFFNTYPHPRQDEVLKQHFKSPALLMATFFAILGNEYYQKLYIIIDEYDQFANAILSYDVKSFQDITSTKGFLKDFYSQLKEATGGPVARIFITGVTTISLDSMTSGFSIATNVTNSSVFATLFGFTDNELRNLIPQLIDLKACGRTLDETFSRMKEWYNGYRFSPRSQETVLNASMCLYYLNYLRLENQEPDSMLDPAFAQDLSKITGILSLGDEAFVKTVVEKALRREPVPFEAVDLQPLNLNSHATFNEIEVLSAMVYLGYFTFSKEAKPALVVPNRAVFTQFFEYYLKYILKAQKSLFNGLAFHEAFDAMAAGDPAPFFHLVCDRFDERSGLHSHLHLQESDFQTLLFAGLLFTNRFHTALEVEVRGLKKGYADLVIAPADGSDARYSYVVELKHLTKAEAAVSGAVDKALAAAKRQATKYAKGENLQSLPQLKRVAAVFVGTTLERLSVL